MKLVVVVVLALVAGCGKRKSEDKAVAPPASTETSGSAQPVQGAPGLPADPTAPEPRRATPADDGGELETKMKPPTAEDTKKPVPADDGGEAMQKACAKPLDCPATHDCCNNVCIAKGTTKHSLECKLPTGNL